MSLQYNVAEYQVTRQRYFPCGKKLKNTPPEYDLHVIFSTSKRGSDVKILLISAIYAIINVYNYANQAVKDCTMRFFGLTEGFEMTKDKVRAIVSVLSVVMLCALAGIGISALLEADAAAAMEEHEQEVIGLIESSSESSEEVTEEPTEEPTTTTTTEATTTTTTETSESLNFETVETTTEETTTTKQTTKETTKKTTAATTTTEKVKEKKYNAIVFATDTINLRTGPGKEYESIRLLDRGDRIDVIALTSNGWYKTIKGNYVMASYTQKKAINTPTPTPKPTKTPTKTPTKSPTKKPTSAPTPTNKPKPSTDKMTLVGTFSVTFYIPFQGTKTASGTTCTMGRTIAANKNDFPFGTILYVENDPLGGDGYYTVEDRGVSSGKIDIFVNSKSDIPSYGRTTRKVYIVNN